MCKITESPLCSHRPLMAVPVKMGEPCVPLPTSTMSEPCLPLDLPTLDGRKRRVRFGDNEEHVFEKDFTIEDHPRMWYNGEEFAAIKAEIYAMIRSVQNGSDPWDSGFHWRGFEHVHEGRPRKQIRKQHVEELLYFCKQGCQDVDLGVLAASNTRETSQRARDLALMDEAEALAIYNEEEEDVPDALSVSSSDDDSEDAYEEDGDSLGWLSYGTGDNDDKSTHLLHQPLQAETTAVSVFYNVPYQLAHMIFPCIC